MNALHLLAMLKAVGMATTVTTSSGHHAIALLALPHGDQLYVVRFDDQYLEDHLKGHLLLSQEILGVQ